jgi:hypothetical protein
MKTHIIMALITGFLLSACASREGRDISSVTNQRQDEPQIHKRNAGHADRDFGHR